MMKGGYKIVDFKDVNITQDDGAVITGIYDSFENNHRKVIMISGITLDGVPKEDCFVDCEISESNYTFSAFGYTFTITAENKVTFKLNLAGLPT